MPTRKAIAPIILTVMAALLASPTGAPGADVDEFKVKRQEVFEFTAAPAVTRQGDSFIITFASKANCDATVAIEDGDGPTAKIVRHLASGCLGPNAPGPFQKDSLAQRIVWDSKDDQGRYVADASRLTIRVSLGLKPAFERTLFWDPRRRISYYPPIIAAAEEGVYVCEGKGVDLVRLFDHAGNYVRTVYPFPASQLDKVQGLEWRTFPQDGAKLPVKQGFSQATLLNSGCNAHFEKSQRSGIGAMAMAARGGRIALAYEYLNRLTSEGATPRIGPAGLDLRGAKTGFDVTIGSTYGKADLVLGPSSAALSPDGKFVYLTGYQWRHGNMAWVGGGLHGVLKVPYDADGEPQVFAGKMTETDFGDGDGQFKCPTGVACDREGRVYVADHMNDRVQVFSPDGKFLKSIATSRPTIVQIHEKTQEFWVISFFVSGVSSAVYKSCGTERPKSLPGTVTRFGQFADPKKISTQPLPLGEPNHGMLELGQSFHVALDSWADPPTLWAVSRRREVSEGLVAYAGAGAINAVAADDWTAASVRVLVEKDGNWTLARDFGAEVLANLKRTRPADHNSQRLFVNPVDGKLYIHEQRHPLKSFEQLARVDPATGAVDLVDTPFEAEDMCFDTAGLAYLRTDREVVRYDPTTWREVPWDYGEERAGLQFNSGRKAPAASALATPGERPVFFHQGGMWVSPKGRLVVACYSRAAEPDRREWKGAIPPGKPYQPTMYPGRARWQEVHVWDEHGKLAFQDAVPGMPINDGIAIDNDDNIYAMLAANRVIDGQPYFNELACTLAKFPAGKGKIVASGGKAPIPLGDADRPPGPPHVRSSKFGQAWLLGASWLYGGVGYGGMNTSRTGGGCACWNGRFALDYFARSFVPEVDHYSVAVLDSAGNLILRVGKYGNVDDGKPLVSPQISQITQRNEQSAPSAESAGRSIGGDEVAIFHACYLATHSDRRLFIADAGNARILGVKLDYHATGRVPLASATSSLKP